MTVVIILTGLDNDFYYVNQPCQNHEKAAYPN
jgi:hypothetical protein